MSASNAISQMFKFQKISDAVSKYGCFSDKNAADKLFSKVSRWVATEKVHGSNFAVYFSADGSSTPSVRFSKRNGLLGDDEWFYNYHLVKNKLVKGVKKVAELLGAEKTVILYGELFGGWYPDVEAAKTWKGAESAGRINARGVSTVPFEERAIQEGIYYSPNVEYMVFDVAVVRSAGIGESTLEFLDFAAMEDILKQTELFYSWPLTIGSFEHAHSYGLEFDSKVPEQLGLHSLPKGSNTAEGIVIKPMVLGGTGDRGSSVRPIIKIKHKKFKEIVDRDFDMEDASRSYQFVFAKLVTQNRYQAVVSKIGRVSEANKDEVLTAYVEDVWEEYYTNFAGNTIISDEEKADAYVRELSRALMTENGIIFA